MASRLNPYISFTDNARQAMEFYKEVFGGTLVLNTFGEYGVEDAPEANNIMHGMLETDRGFTIMGADTPPGMELNRGDNIAVSLSGDDADDLRGYWAEALRGRHGDDATREADVGRRVRHVRRPVRHRLDGQHRSTSGLIRSTRAPDRRASHEISGWTGYLVPGLPTGDELRDPVRWLGLHDGFDD